MKVVISSGYFNPMHKGHEEYFELAKKLFKDSYHIVIINNEEQAIAKKGRIIVPLYQRIIEVNKSSYVDEIFVSIDEDKSVCKSLEFLANLYKGNKMVFAKGGDRTSSEIPEAEVCKRYGIEIRDKLGEKIESSSHLIEKLGL